MHTIEKLGAISGLPRSGSTLLCNLLAQNERIHTTPTSGLLDVMFGARGSYSSSRECQAQDLKTMDKAWLAFCRGGMTAWAESLTDRPVYLDKSRGYHAFYPWFRSVDPDFKLLVTVRDLRGILASLERRFQADRYRADFNEKPAEGKMTTLQLRLQHWIASPMLGVPLARLRDLVTTGQVADVRVVRYEDMLKDPDGELAAIYTYLGEEPFDHDFENIPQYTQENDSGYGPYGRHEIDSKLAESNNRWREELPKEAQEYITKTCEWYFKTFYPTKPRKTKK